MDEVKDLTISHVTDEVLKAMVEHFPDVQSLSIDASRISDAGIRPLLELTSLKSLEIKNPSQSNLKSLDKPTSILELKISGEFEADSLKGFRSNNPAAKITN